MMSRTDVARARWQLWAVALAIMAVLGGITVFLVTHADPVADTVLPSRRLLAAALLGMIGAFVAYAIDRERNLHRLTDRLVAEQIESERLSTRLRYLAELSRERDTNAALLDASADGIAVVDRDGVVLRFNATLAALTGTPAADALGRPSGDALGFADAHGDTLEGLDDPLYAALADGVPRAAVELQLVHRGGGARWVSGTFSPIADPDSDRPTLVLVTLRDIAEQKEQEAMQRDFVSMAAHELRSPLTAIKGFTRTLMTKFDRLTPDRRSEYLGLVNEQSNRLAVLVDDLMEVSRIDAGRVWLSPEEIDLGDLVRRLVTEFRAKWSNRSIDVAESGVLPRVLADRRKTEEILINLIDNAIKYSPEGAPVEVRMRASGTTVEVSVADRGHGIPLEEQRDLFRKFHRLSGATRSDVPGTGLGLYIVKGLVEAHGGAVWVESVSEAGSTFSFTLPAGQARPEVRTA